MFGDYTTGEMEIELREFHSWDQT